jgi:hypothetical protein
MSGSNGAAPFGDQAIIGAAESPRHLRELLDAHREVKPGQDVFGLRM